jgi:hypothetical protein
MSCAFASILARAASARHFERTVYVRAPAPANLLINVLIKKTRQSPSARSSPGSLILWDCAGECALYFWRSFCAHLAPGMARVHRASLAGGRWTASSLPRHLPGAVTAAPAPWPAAAAAAAAARGALPARRRPPSWPCDKDAMSRCVCSPSRRRPSILSSMRSSLATSCCSALLSSLRSAGCRRSSSTGTLTRRGRGWRVGWARCRCWPSVAPWSARGPRPSLTSIRQLRFSPLSSSASARSPSSRAPRARPLPS